MSDDNHVERRITVDMDVGGTFTDGFFTEGHDHVAVKVDTTPHDLMECFWACLKGGANRLGVSIESMLKRTKVIRFATTVGTNAILEGKGPKLGLIVNQEEERRVYAPGTTSPLLGDFVDEALVVGISMTAESGQEDEDQIRGSIRQLLDLGARQIVVSFGGNGRRRDKERLFRDVVRRHFPQHYLCSAPLLLSTEIRDRADDYTRTNTAVLDAYLRQDLARSLYRIEDRLRDAGYPYPLLVTHSSGGAARVSKSRAIDTYNSGPSAGLLGSADYAKSYGLRDVITVDIGGTSTDVGFIEDSEPVYDFNSQISGVDVSLPFYLVRSIGGGGGSVAVLERQTNTLRVGPESAGAVPGPASYGLGGTDATLTDASVILGYLDPGRFLGGRRALSFDEGYRVIANAIAKPLGVSVEEAAFAIYEELGSSISRSIRSLAQDRQRDISSLFVFGGAGGLIAPQLLKNLDVDIFLFRYGSVLNAYGSSKLDVVHLYERAIGLPVGRVLLQDLVTLAAEMESTGRRDMRSEGLTISEWRLELEIQDRQDRLHVTKGVLDGSWSDLIARLIKKTDPTAELLAIRSFALASTPRPLTDYNDEDEIQAIPNPLPQKIGTRSTLFDGRTRVEASVFDWEVLEAMSIVRGPALVEAMDTTVLVPPGYTLELDSSKNARLSWDDT